MEYVYRYVDETDTTVYVGITNDLNKRIKEHKADKLAEIRNPKIYYIPVENRNDAEILETYLINHFDTGRFYNAKKLKGSVTFIDVCDHIPWVVYNGFVNPLLMPFHISQVVEKTLINVIPVEKEIVVEKEIPESKMSDERMIRKLDHEFVQTMEFFDSELEKENNIVEFVNQEIDFINRKTVMTESDVTYVSLTEKTLPLHKERILCLEKCKTLYPQLVGNSDLKPQFFNCARKAGLLQDEYYNLLKKGEHKAYENTSLQWILG